MAIESKPLKEMTNPELRNGIIDLGKLIEWKIDQINKALSSDTDAMKLLKEDLSFYKELKEKYEKKLGAQR